MLIMHCIQATLEIKLNKACYPPPSPPFPCTNSVDILNTDLQALIHFYLAEKKKERRNETKIT